MNLIQKLEALGQSGSLKQFNSVSEMLNHNNLDTKIISQIKNCKKELFCLVEPDDDED